MSRICSGGAIKQAEADAFANELLMPRRLILKALREHPHITASELAKLFEVAEEDMTRRLIKLRLP